MSLDAGGAELNAALKDLKRLWDDVRPGWNDPVSRDFEEHTWNALESQTIAVLRALDRLGPVLLRARRECS
jgi:hypothetical protein